MTEAQPGDWAWSLEHRQVCRVVEAQDLWGAALCRVWLPASEAFVRVRSDRLRPVAEAGAAGQAWLTYVAAAARVADALAQDALLAPIESSVIPLPHQIRALSRATAGGRVRYLLADEVGLGKTIEAGLIMRELKLRGIVRRTLVVAPKGLVNQWVAEMLTHFAEEFRALVPSDFPHSAVSPRRTTSGEPALRSSARWTRSSRSTDAAGGRGNGWRNTTATGSRT